VTETKATLSGGMIFFDVSEDVREKFICNRGYKCTHRFINNFYILLSTGRLFVLLILVVTSAAEDINQMKETGTLIVTLPITAS
jgi:hypothetical protein